ncbi:MAG: helix-turn-helix domain-containing protein [Clostridiales bacterium]|nr:helix-turn-helix domain-containing protein [Clostridiales bacterium]
MLNIDVICYFLKKYRYTFSVDHYDPLIAVDKIRHFDDTESLTRALMIYECGLPSDIAAHRQKLPEISEANIVLITVPAAHEKVLSRQNFLPHNTIFSPNVSNTESFSDNERFSCPVITVASDEPAKLCNKLHEIFERLGRWEQQMEIFNLAGKNYQELLDLCDSILDEPVSFADKNFTYIAYSREMSEKRGYIHKYVNHGRLSIEIAAQLMSTPGFELLEKETEVFEFEDDYHFIAKNIHHEGRFEARLLMIFADEPLTDAYHKYILKRLGDCITEKYEREGTFYLEEEATHRIHLLMQTSLDGQPVSDTLWSQALKEKSWLIQDSYTLMIFKPTYRLEKNLHSGYLCPQIENMWPYTAAAPWHEKTIVLINQKHIDKNFEQSLTYFVRDNLLTAGISRCFYDFSKIRYAYIQAEAAAAIGTEKEPHLWHYFFDDYAVTYLKQQCMQQMPAECICHPALIQLQAYDKKNQTCYYESLKLFIETQYNMSAAADLAYVHRTTFIKRMEKIEKMTGIDLKDWNTRMYLMLSYSLINET